MLGERGLSVVTSTTAMLVITVLIGLIAAVSLLDFASVLSGEPRVEGAVTYSQVGNTVEVRVVSLQAADRIYVRPVDNGTMNWTGAMETRYGYAIHGSDGDCDVGDTASVTVSGDARLLVIAENGDTRRVVQDIET